MNTQKTSEQLGFLDFPLSGLEAAYRAALLVLSGAGLSCGPAFFCVPRAT